MPRSNENCPVCGHFMQEVQMPLIDGKNVVVILNCLGKTGTEHTVEIKKVVALGKGTRIAKKATQKASTKSTKKRTTKR